MIAHKKSGLHGYGLYLLSGAYFVLQFLCSNKKFLSLCVFLSPYFLLTFFLRPLPAPYLFAWSVRSLMQRVLYYAGALPYAFCWQRSYMPAAKRFFSFGTRRQCACRLKTVYDMHACQLPPCLALWRFVQRITILYAASQVLSVHKGRYLS